MTIQGNDTFVGLSEIEADARLKAYGPNELPSSRRRGFGAILWGIFREPMFLLFFAMGAWRISKKNVLTRRVPAVENLGTTTILCVDKTGTLTENRMFLQSLRTRDHEMKLAHDLQSLPEEFHVLEEYAVLASHKDPFDPMEKAIRESALAGLSGTEHLHDDWELVREYPLSARLLAMSCVWMSPDGVDYCIAAKGAPEAIIDLCHLDLNERQHWERLIQEMADQGLRLLGVARARFSKKTLPVDQHDFNFEFVGLLGLLDPIRPEVPQAIRECEQAGIRVMMITGDYPGTARHIAREIGLQDFDKILTGEEMEKMDEATLRMKIQSVSIVARAAAFMSLIVSNLGLILTNRSLVQTVIHTGHVRNNILWALVGLACLFLTLILLIPGLRHLFGFDLIGVKDGFMALMVGISNLLWFEMLKKYLSDLKEEE